MKKRLFEEDSFVALDSDWIQALRCDGDDGLTLNELSVLLLIQDGISWATGVYMGCAEKLELHTNGQLHEETILKILASLRKKQRIKSFYKKGKKGNYHILLHGFKIREGEKKGWVLDALATTDPKKPVYVKKLAQSPSGSPDDTDDISAKKLVESPSASPDDPNLSPSESPDDDLTVTGSSPEDDRIVTGSSPEDDPAKLGTILDSSDIPDSSEGSENSEPTDKPTIQPNLPSKSRTDGRFTLATLLAELFRDEQVRGIVPKDTEITGIDSLAAKVGEGAVIVAFREYLDRPQGFDHLAYPLSMFLQEADSWIGMTRDEESARSHWQAYWEERQWREARTTQIAA